MVTQTRADEIPLTFGDMVRHRAVNEVPIYGKVSQINNIHTAGRR